MNRIELVESIGRFSGENNQFDLLEGSLAGLSNEALRDNLLYCGIIPEKFQHDSSKEKLWAKYCDILLAKTLSFLGIESEVIRARGDSADVLGKTEEYTIVGDAKAFRLSRTAKNQKDFKVNALDDWRRENTFAVLVGPFYQFPLTRSQIYEQAERLNVTLLSYIHLVFLFDNYQGNSLRSLWGVSGGISPSKSASEYWMAVEGIILDITGSSHSELREYKAMEIEKMRGIGRQEIEYWKTVIEEYRNLSREEAIDKLIIAEKIHNKISVIQKIIEREHGL